MSIPPVLGECGEVCGEELLRTAWAGHPEHWAFLSNAWISLSSEMRIVSLLLSYHLATAYPRWRQSALIEDIELRSSARTSTTAPWSTVT